MKELVKPKVGMGATLIVGSDSYACTITRVSDTGKTFWMQRDVAQRIDNNGISESQEYEYTRNELGTKYQVRLCKNNIWRVRCARCMTVAVGFRRQYLDPCF